MVCCIVLLCMMLGLFLYVSLQQSLHCNPNSPFYLFFLLTIKILNLDHLHLITSFFPEFFKLFFECFKLFCKFFQDFFFWIVLRGFFYLKLSIYLWSPSFFQRIFFIDFLLLFLGIFLCLLIWFRNTNFSRFIAQFQIFFLIQ